MQSNGPSASKLEADGVEAEREWRPCEWLRKYADSAHTRAVRSRRVSSCASRGVRLAMLWHRLCMGRGSSTVSWKTLEVCGGVVLANQSGSVVSSQGSTTSSSSYSSSIAEQDHKSPRELSFRPSSTYDNPSRQTSSSSMESRHRRAFLFANSVHRGNSLSSCPSPQPRFALIL
jgi:hypothetical protein